MVERPNDAINITTNATTAIGAAGVHTSLYRVIINTAGATTPTLKIYKGQTAVAANLIATVNSGTERTLDFGGLRSRDGFCFVTSATTPADVTIVFD